MNWKIVFLGKYKGSKATAVALLLLAYALLLSSAQRNSAVADEPGHLFRGYAYLKTGATHFLWGHPLFASSLNASLLLTEPALQLPTETAAWADGEWEIASDHFLWQAANPQRLIFLGRLATLWLTLLLAVLAFRWAKQAGGAKAGLLALVVCLFDPNTMAHGRFITSDIALSFFCLLTLYAFWRWTLNPKQDRFLLLAGMAVGMAGATKFNAAALLPVLGLLTLVLMRSWGWQRPLRALVVIGMMAAVTIWGIYHFQISPIPAAGYWQDLRWQLDYFQQPHGAYLLGRYAATGWWYYFPVVFLLKTPTPLLLLLTLATARSFFSRFSAPHFSLSTCHLPLLFPLVYFLISLITPLNIGYRHLIPILPFLAIWLGVTLAQTGWPAWGLAVLLLVVNLSAWPNYVAYFNTLAGPTAVRWQLLSDSNVDWGQDLPALAEWQKANPQQPLHLSYFGTAHPSAYGLQFIPLPTWSPGPEQGDPARQAFNPLDPAPGWYAISVTNLHGLVLGEQQGMFAWFRDKEPMARLGGSIFVYDVPAHGPPAQIAFGGLRPLDLPLALHSLFGTNDVRVHWFDPATSFVWPAGGGWLAVNKGEVDEALRPLWPTNPISQTTHIALYTLNTPPALPQNSLPTPMQAATFLGYTPLPSLDGIALLTWWRVEQASPPPLKIFVHVLNAQGDIVAQWDRLDVDSSAWQVGDVFVQLHRFPAPTTEMTHLRIGLYNAQTLFQLGMVTFSHTP